MKLSSISSLTFWFWSLVHYCCRFDTDTGAMALCALLASRLIRIGANRMTSVLSRG
ncbi:hypothetical protein PQR25_22395 [Paraburkholderia nemoris]|uniref:hypothetical protein n=1 Tax=Paraburkholderia nemoris TaxID=2793076 RepID=UPI0038BDB4EB